MMSCLMLACSQLDYQHRESNCKILSDENIEVGDLIIPPVKVINVNLLASLEYPCLLEVTTSYRDVSYLINQIT